MYELLGGTSPKQLAENVNEYLAKGYKLHGSPFQTMNGSYWQAVIKMD